MNLNTERISKRIEKAIAEILSEVRMINHKITNLERKKRKIIKDICKKYEVNEGNIRNIIKGKYVYKSNDRHEKI